RRRDRHDRWRPAGRPGRDPAPAREARRGLRPRLRLEGAAARPAAPPAPVPRLQHGHALDFGRPAARHELRPEGLPRRGRPRPPALRRAPSLHPGARPPPRVPDRRAAGQPPTPRARPLPLRARAVPARLPRPAHRVLHRTVPPPAAPPVRGAGALVVAGRDRDPRLPDDREAPRARDRATAAADPRRPARRRRAAGLLPRPDHRADHEPPRRARFGARAGRGARRRDPELKLLYFGTYERRYPRNAQVISCLRRAGVEVVERHAAVWEGREQKWRAGLVAAT